MSGVAVQETEIKSFACLMKLDMTVKETHFTFEIPTDVKTIVKKFEWVRYCKIGFRHLALF